MTSSPYGARPWLQHYDYWVRPHLTYPRRPLYDVLSTTAIDLPDRPATTFFGAELTFAQLKDRADRLAAAPPRLGVAPGGPVGIMLPNSPQYILAPLPVLRLGARAVHTHPPFTTRRL